MAEIIEVIEKLGSAFEAFKQANDERLKEIEQKGHADPLLEEKVNKLSLALGEIDKLKTQVDLVETRQARLPLMDETGVSPKSEHRKAFDQFIRRGRESDLRELEVKALNITTGADGAFAVPEELDRQVEGLVLEYSPMRSLARVISVGSSDYKTLMNLHGATSGWVGEAAARPETTTPALAEITAPMGEIYSNPAATQQMLDDAFFDAENWLGEEIASEFAQEEGDAFINGNGTNKPKGFLQYTMASTVDGTRAFGSIQYKATGVSGAFKTTSASVSPADDLVDIIYSMKKAHRQNASWIGNALTLAAIRKFKDNNGAYVWQPGMAQGSPSTILQYPYAEMPDMPDIAANAYVLAFGDWKRGYVIVDRKPVRVLRDPYTNKPYVHFYTTKRVGGFVKNTEAIKVLKLGTS